MKIYFSLSFLCRISRQLSQNAEIEVNSDFDVVERINIIIRVSQA